MQQRIQYTVCPLCSSKKLVNSVVGDCSQHPLYDAAISSKMQWVDCSECHHQFIDGYFTNDTLDIVFSKTHENQKVGYQIEAQRKVSAKIIERVLPYKPAGTWLDVGFGNGSLLFTAQEFGYHPIGVDLRKDSVNSIKRLGFETYCQSVETVEFSREISVVSMMDVLEHIPYPKDVLISLKSKMEVDGCLLISMPNTENIIWKLMTKQNQNPYLGELEHYHNFSRTRLISLLDECGFDVVRYGISERYRVCMEIVAIKR
ncbi:class I SAM-dependent methyltransferase [Planktomarina temperata]|nr:class I SAM-dependent methyltransferase [Planktomarina temperata]